LFWHNPPFDSQLQSPSCTGSSLHLLGQFMKRGSPL
jgi:hypothetical protein